MKQSNPLIWQPQPAQNLSRALAAIGDVASMQNFLRDVLTEAEITEISARFEAARLLQEGARYATIINQTKLSSRTVARISDWLKNGCGGYQIALTLVHHHPLTPAGKSLD